jgi:hypothetical protein
MWMQVSPEFEELEFLEFTAEEDSGFTIEEELPVQYWVMPIAHSSSGEYPHSGINALHCTITELELPSTSLLDTGLLLLEPGKPFVSELVIASGTTGLLELSSQAMNANAATATATPKFLNSKFRRIPYSFFVYGM